MSYWYEVWVDDGLEVPYALIVLQDQTGQIVVLDPKEDYKPIFKAADYEAVKMWLLEDEYTRVDGRMTREE
jgi:hypothetical protein